MTRVVSSAARRLTVRQYLSSPHCCLKPFKPLLLSVLYVDVRFLSGPLHILCLVLLLLHECFLCHIAQRIMDFCKKAVIRYLNIVFLKEG
eukprot:c28424_g1_i1 orf=51-320(+)